MRIPRRTLFVLVGVFTLVLLAGAGYLLYQKYHVVPEGEVYSVAPDFSLPGSDGNMVTLSEVDGTVRIINFWASWSPYSRDELIALVALKKQYGNDLTVIALDRDTNPNDGRAFIASLGLSDELTFVFDEQDGYFKEVKGFAVPETMFLDEDGNIRAQSHGPMTYEEMDAAVQMILE